MPKQPIGLYLHVPFCASKCPYCDFYSMRPKAGELDHYCAVLETQIVESYKALCRKADTLYIGGGTPSLLGAERLARLIQTAKDTYLLPEAEITVECNPYGLDAAFFETLYGAGANRISLGMQSAVDKERKKLGRRADHHMVENVIDMARAAGFSNISLDVMLGIPYQTAESLEETLHFVEKTGVPHVSVYLLKLEAGTPFYKLRESLPIADDDEAADLYLQTVKTLSSMGYAQYEISNFAKQGYGGRHNLKYWHCEEYLGLGPSAHGFLDGKRFYFPRDIDAFLQNKRPIPDGTGGDFLEYAMLALRLTEGLQEHKVQARFGHGIPKAMRQKAERYETMQLLTNDTKGIRLLPTGFLLSNPILADLLDIE